MRISVVITSIACLFLSVSAWAQTLPIGNLVHDGPATPEQLSLLLPVTGSLSTSASATVRYRRSGSSTWTTGHPMYRVRPQFSNSPSIGTVTDDFAWPIINLSPGRVYDVEVTVTDGTATEVRSASFTTRSLPPASGAPNKTITGGSSSNAIQAAFDGLNPGDVLEFQNGTYNVNQLDIARSGTSNNPIYIRGASREGVILSDPNDEILGIRNANHIVIENLTLRGSETDGGSNIWSVGILGLGNSNGTTRNTIRNVTIVGVDQGINFFASISQALVYNNTVIGNNLWNAEFLGDNRTWDDDGILLPGTGNVAFNNTISNFGDTFAYAQHSGNSTQNETRGVHYYRNEIRNSLDDLAEADYGQRNISFYDNRSHNSSTCSSLDPLYGGPFLYARNICINPARSSLHKWNDSNSGQFIYNSTFIITTTAALFNADLAAWYQPNNGGQRAYGFRNNILVYGGNGDLLWLDSGGHDPIDWTHNSWYPDARIQWDGVYSSLRSAQRGLSNTTPVFSGINRRMENDNITVANPWTTVIGLGSNSLTEVTATFTPQLSGGTSPKNSGVDIPNITDGFSGAAPDRGAIISGRPLPNWGDQSSSSPIVIRPSAPSSLEANPSI